MSAKPEKEKRSLSGDTFIKLVRAVTSISGRVHAGLGREGLTRSQFGVLEAIHTAGPMRQGELAGKILKTGGNVTMAVDNLEKRGLVVRAKDESDRRAYLVSLTTEGERLIGRVLPGVVQAIEREMAALSPAQLKELGALCKKLGQPAGGGKS